MADEVQIQVHGLKEFQGAIRKVDNSLGPELRKGLNEVAQIVVDAAVSLVPVRSGDAAGSIKAGSSQRAASIKVGGSKAAYFPWLDFGGNTGRNKSIHRPFIQQGRYIYPSLAAKRDETRQRLDEVLKRLATQAGFDTHGVA